MLVILEGPPWLTPLLKFFFTVSYVLLAFVVGAFADSMPKGRVMFITNTVKIAGCLMLFFHEAWSLPGLPEYVTVLFAYAVVGLGAAAYSPAKYGILTEYLPHHKLVIANGWIEGLTVGSIILGTLLGGAPEQAPAPRRRDAPQAPAPDQGGGIGDILGSPLGKAVLGGIAAFAMKEMMNKNRRG